MTGASFRIAVASQNFRTITPHAGKTRRWLVFDCEEDSGAIVPADRLDLPRGMAIHDWGDRADPHPLFEMDAVIVASCGAGFLRRLGRHGVRVAVAATPDPEAEVANFLASGAMQTPFEVYLADTMARAAANHAH
ncbi:Nitrogen fixation-related protein [Roseibacterium elongatum DSM 19469]|uniref:Nitrogen fixation-related protein n=1 Tax=Roseicyclus elongatus DSM 19469 TaxID=1294273 RepID=W8RN82_9RHOB|nr:NifB/NifX family molybdenum-iron cluster-binding protein [Roseibacterium elongatum]AHM02589.1 Nitrogen fixation-related protein [Roseibacterium elongatum DSM 19469]